MWRLFGCKGVRDVGVTAAGIGVALSSWRSLSPEHERTITEEESKLAVRPQSSKHLANCSSCADPSAKSSTRSRDRDYGIFPSVCNAPFSSCGEATYEDSKSAVSPPAGTLHNNAVADTIARCRRLVRRKMLERGIPGAVVAVVKDGRLVWSEGMGYADVENDVPCTPETVMRIASISKPLTAVALFQLWQRGLVDLDAPIQKYVPEFPEKTYNGEKVDISLRQLLSHLSGIRHYSKTKEEDTKEFDKKEYYIRRHYHSVLDSLQLFHQDELLSKPGTEYYYTTHGWTLISAAIEKISNQKFLQYMSSQVFKPLGMASTCGEFHTPLVYSRARHYTRSKDGLLKNTPYVDISYKWAGGGFISTAEDLTRFGNALLTCYQMSRRPSDDANGPLSKLRPVASSSKEQQLLGANLDDDTATRKCILEHDTVSMMWRPVVSPDKSKPELSYGMGWVVREGDGGTVGGKERPFYAAHSGGAVGASSILVIMPSTSVRSNKMSSSQSSSTQSSAEVQRERRRGRVDVPRGVVVAVLFNLQEVKNVTSLGVEIAEEFLSTNIIT